MQGNTGFTSAQSLPRCCILIWRREVKKVLAQSLGAGLAFVRERSTLISRHKVQV